MTETMFDVRVTTSYRTDVETVRAAPAEAEPMQYGTRCIKPRAIRLSFTNWHDGNGWQLAGLVYGPWILVSGELGRREGQVIVGLGNGSDPQWVLDLIAENMPPDTFDVGKRGGVKAVVAAS